MSIKLKSIAVVGALLGSLVLAGCGEKEKIPIASKSVLLWGKS